MSRKDYEAIAAIIAGQMADVGAQYDDGIIDGLTYRAVEFTLRTVADNLCELFKADNRSFNRRRFLSACDVLKPSEQPTEPTATGS